MADDPRVFSDEEFARILRKAAELARNEESPAASSGGLTLLEMKSAAAQAGLDPTLVERAARMLASTAAASPIERLAGGPLRHNFDVRFPTTLDENRAALLLSAVRISAGLAGSRDAGHSSSMGMTWHDGGEIESLGITARPEENGTAVSIAVDRRGTLGLVVLASGMAMFFTTLFSAFALYPEAPALGVAGFIAGTGGALALARGYWKSSTKKVRERIDRVMDVIGRTLDENEPPVARLEKFADRAARPATHASVAGEPEITGT